VRSVTLRVLVVLLGVSVVATTAQAQRRRARPSAAAVGRPHLGGHLGYNFDVDELLLGAQLSYPITPRLDLYPSFDYYFVSSPASLWSLNFDVKYRPPTRYGAFYVGGGINYRHASVSGVGGSDTNLNLLAGFERVWRARVRPYIETKLILGDGSSFQIVGGMSWAL